MRRVVKVVGISTKIAQNGNRGFHEVVQVKGRETQQTLHGNLDT
jgi:hypothetical protein